MTTSSAVLRLMWKYSHNMEDIVLGSRSIFFFLYAVSWLVIGRGLNRYVTQLSEGNKTERLRPISPSTMSEIMVPRRLVTTNELSTLIFEAHPVRQTEQSNVPVKMHPLYVASRVSYVAGGKFTFNGNRSQGVISVESRSSEKCSEQPRYNNICWGNREWHTILSVDYASEKSLSAS